MRFPRQQLVCVGFPQDVVRRLQSHVPDTCELLHIEGPFAARDSVRSRTTEALLLFLPADSNQLQVTEYCRLLQKAKGAATICISSGAVRLTHALALARSGLQHAIDLSDDWPRLLQDALSANQPGSSAIDWARLVGFCGWPARYLTASVEVAIRQGNACALARAMNLTERTLRKKCIRYKVPSPRVALRLGAILHEAYMRSTHQHMHSLLNRNGANPSDQPQGNTATSFRFLNKHQFKDSGELASTIRQVREGFGRVPDGEEGAE